MSIEVRRILFRSLLLTAGATPQDKLKYIVFKRKIEVYSKPFPRTLVAFDSINVNKEKVEKFKFSFSRSVEAKKSNFFFKLKFTKLGKKIVHTIING